jgi:hypothetical protein
MMTVEKARKRLRELQANTKTPPKSAEVVIALSASLEERLQQALDEARLDYGRGAEIEIPLLWRVEEIADLLAARQELAELRSVLDGRLTVWASWRDSGELPDDVGLSDPDGDQIDVELDASGLIDEVRRRQAKAAIRRHELSDPLGPELGAVLALVPAGLGLCVWPRDSGGYTADWRTDEPRILALDSGPTREAAILAATAKLLDLDEASLRRRVAGSPAAVVKAAMAWADEQDPDRLAYEDSALYDAVEQLRGATRSPCSTCVNWIKTDEETPDGTRLCRLRPDLPARTGDSSCPDGYDPLDEAEGDDG